MAQMEKKWGNQKVRAGVVLFGASSGDPKPLTAKKANLHPP